MNRHALRRLAQVAVALAALGLASSPRPAFAQSKPPPAARPDEASRLEQEALAHYQARRYPEARALTERVLALREKALGPRHLKVANSLRDLAELHLVQGELDKAEALYLRALEIVRGELGQDDLATTGLLTNLGVIKLEKNDASGAESLYQKVLAIRERHLPPGHPEIVSAIDRVADVHRARGEHDRAIELYQRAHALREKAIGPDHPVIAGSLQALASAHLAKADYKKARELLERALAIREKAEGPQTLEVALVCNNLAELHLTLGDYLRAEPLYERALRIYEKAKGPDHPDVATLLNNLASLHGDRGDHDRAIQLLQRAVAIYERALGKEHDDVARALNNLAEMHMRKHDLAAAAPLLERALAIREKLHGKEGASLAVSLHNLASLHQERGEPDRAEPLFTRALAIYRKTRGPDDADASRALNNLASLHDDRGDVARAQALYEEAIASQERSLGADHPLIAISLHNLASVHEKKPDIPRALAAYRRANEIAEQHLGIMLTAGSEQQRLRYMDTLRWLTHGTISFHQQRAGRDVEAARLALTTALRRKGRVLDAVTAGVQSLRGRLTPAGAAKLDELGQVRAAVASATLSGGGGAGAVAELRSLEERSQALEAALEAESAEWRAVARPATIEDVQAALPPGAALIEIVSYVPFDPKRPRLGRWGAPRYAAYVVKRTGEPASVDLGDAAPIDAAVAALRAALADPRIARAKELARALGAMLVDPIEPLLGGARDVLVSPDGALNLVPWGALVDASGRWLIQRGSLTYLTSGRDLMRLAVRAESREKPTILANPAFDSAAAAPAGGGARRDAAAPADRGFIAKLRFPPLPGTAGEATALGGVLAGARLLTAERATKAALRGVHGPAILHIATHGFFFDAQSRPAAQTGTRGFELEAESPAAAAGAAKGAPVENPLLRSGLALAGANAAGEARADGVLTALEASGLDLHGTKLVVLSACETGVGDVKTGDGVYGLRRALVMAGAETQVMSLWKVADEATRELMIGYYRRLEAGEGRSEAMRNVQLELLADADTAHPFYWSSFIVSGDPSAIRSAGARPAGQVDPGARGCSCHVPGGRGSGTPAWALPAAAGIVLLRRRRPSPRPIPRCARACGRLP